MNIFYRFFFPGKLRANIKIRQLLFLLLFFQLFFHSLKAQTTGIYVSLSDKEFGWLDIDSCKFHKVGSTTVVMFDIAVCPNGTMYGVDGSGQLYTINSTTAGTTLVGNMGTTLNSLVCDKNNQLWGATGSNTNLYKVNSSNGSLTNLGNMGYSAAGDLTYYNDTLYLAEANNKLIRINTTSPINTTVIGTMTPVQGGCVVGGTCPQPGCLSTTTSNGVCTCTLCGTGGTVFGIVTVWNGVCGTKPTMYGTQNGNLLTVDPMTAAMTAKCPNITPADIYGLASVTESAKPCPFSVTVTGGAICPGNCMALTSTITKGTSPFTYSWNPGAGTSSSFNVCPTSTTTYTLSISDKTGTSASTTATVTVNPSPTVNISGNTSICTGSGTTLTAGGGGTYNWNTGATTTSITVSPTSNTSYTVIATQNGCTGSAQVNVTVIPIPTVTTSPTTICAGGTATLTATGGPNYLWSTGATTSSITVSPVTTTSYTITVNNSGCSSSAVATVTVGSSIVPVITGNTTICNGQSTTLSTSGGTYSWSDGSTGSSITVNPTSNTTYTVTVVAGSCSGTATVQVTVVNNPTPTISGNTNICAGSSTTLTASGGSTYIWDNGTSDTTLTVSPTVQTTYTVTANTSGCTGQTTVIVSITPPPTPGITGNTTICAGTSTTLTATGGGTYQWGSGATTTSITVSPSSTTTYSVIVASPGGCTAGASVVVTVQSNLTPIITGNTSICVGASTTLSTSTSGTYSWSDGSTGSSITVSPATTITYSLTVTSGLCSGSATVQVTVNQPPVPSISGITTLCLGQSTTLTATSGGTYSWSNGQTNNPMTVTPPVGITTYTVTVTTNGCTGQTSIQVTVNPIPQPTITGTTSICTGQSTTLTSSTTGPYSWNTGNTTASITVSPVTTTTYSVSVTQNGCTGTGSIVVNVIAPVKASITGNDICAGQTVLLTATSGGTNYLWSPGGQTTSSIKDAPTVTTTYTVIIGVGSCMDTASFTVNVNPLPIPGATGDTTITYGQSTQLNATGGGTYQWIPSVGLSCSNCPNPIATPEQSTQYCAIVTTPAGCSDSACVMVTVTLKCGFEGEVFVANGFSPNGDGQNDVLYVRGLGITQLYWAIYDRWGEKVFETTNPKQGWDGTYKGQELDPAVFVYTLHVTCITGDEINKKGNVAIIK